MHQRVTLTYGRLRLSCALSRASSSAVVVSRCSVRMLRGWPGSSWPTPFGMPCSVVNKQAAAALCLYYMSCSSRVVCCLWCSAVQACCASIVGLLAGTRGVRCGTQNACCFTAVACVQFGTRCAVLGDDFVPYVCWVRRQAAPANMLEACAQHAVVLHHVAVGSSCCLHTMYCV